MNTPNPCGFRGCRASASGVLPVLRLPVFAVRMSGFLFVLGLAGGLVLCLAGGLAAANDLRFGSVEESQAEFERTVKPFLARHCVECHGEKNREADLDLTKLDSDMGASSDGARWALVVDNIESGEMPPKDKPRPSADSIAATIRWARAEAKRTKRSFTKRVASQNGNDLKHSSLFDPGHVSKFDGRPRIRPLSPENYDRAMGADKFKLSQPFSPAAGTTFQDMGNGKIDEPVTVALMSNALEVVAAMSAHVIEGGKITNAKGQRELVALFDPAAPPTDAQIEAAINFMFKRFVKRPPTAVELEKFVKLMKRMAAEAGQEVGTRYGLAAVLMLPEVVFRLELGDGQSDQLGRKRLAPREIAFAVSRALGDDLPSDSLLAAAGSGKLDTDAGVAEQVKQMLADPKIQKPRIMRFFREYFGYHKAETVFKQNANDESSRVVFKHHDPQRLVADTDRLVEYILEQDRDVLRELLTTNKIFVSYKDAAQLKEQLAKERAKFEADAEKNPEKFKGKVFDPKVWLYYESYSLSEYPDEQPVEMPNGQRAGILTQPSWLVANSTAMDNHAIHRGRWIRERLLGGVVPDVPITVDAQLPIAPEKTLRERMAVTEQEYCWQCHRLMNDLAYPFEQYDHFGRFRTEEQVVDLEATEKNVDKKGKSLGPVMRNVPIKMHGLVAHAGDASLGASLEGPVSSPAELMQRLAGSELVEQVFVRHAFRYWMGRNESLGDAASLQAAHKAYKENGGSMRALITSILSSESFLYRVPEPQEASASARAESGSSGS